jgi:lysozyme family protein
MTFTPSPRFLACMPFILKEEGGYSNTPGDHGGATDDGIIQSEYNAFRFSQKEPLQSVRLITPGEYDTIYWQKYWNPNCPKLPIGLDLSVFNIDVNGGGSRGTRLLQQCLGIEIDGIWGGETDMAVAAITNVTPILQAFHADERAFYQAIINHDPSQQKFASDWFGRNDRCEALSLQMAAAADPAMNKALDEFAADKPPSIMKET